MVVAVTRSSLSAMPAAASATPEHIKNVNTRYHDAAAASYDAKWGIDYGEIGMRQVRAKVIKALGGEPQSAVRRRARDRLGTGYFSLNLLQLGLVERVTATDISPGMLARAARERPAPAASRSTTACTDAEALPFADQQLRSRLRPRGPASHPRPRTAPSASSIASCVPAAHSSSAASPRATAIASPPCPSAPACSRRRCGGAWSAPRRFRRTASGAPTDTSSSPRSTSTPSIPSQLRDLIGAAASARSSLRGEELVANAYGWWLRTLESSAEPDQVPFSWRHFAYRSYMALQRVDTSLLEPRLPPELFYNLVLSARKPTGPRPGRTCASGNDYGARMELEADVVVVGAGFAGLAAARAARGRGTRRGGARGA